MEKNYYQKGIVWFTNEHCNLNCDYCGNSNNKEKIQEIKISEFIDTLEKEEKIFHIILTGGGEPFLTPNFINLCKKISKKNFLSIYTNLTSDKIKEFAEIIDPNKVIQIIASLHIKELEKRKLFNSYINNYKLLKKKGFNIIPTAVAYPKLKNEINKYIGIFENKGISIKFMPFAGPFNGKLYPRDYSDEDLIIFRLEKTLRKTYDNKGKMCNAGYNNVFADSRGNVYSCIMNKKAIGNIYKKINYNNKPIRCQYDYCSCPFFYVDNYLYNLALKNDIKFRLLNKYYKIKLKLLP